MDAFDQFRSDARVRLASLMDHAPGQRQFQTMDQYTLYYKTKRGLSDEAFERYVDAAQGAVGALFGAAPPGDRRPLRRGRRDAGQP